MNFTRTDLMVKYKSSTGNDVPSYLEGSDEIDYIEWLEEIVINRYREGLDSSSYISNSKLLQKLVYEIALNKGWRVDVSNFHEINTQLLLIVSEISEVVEGLRENPASKSDKIPEFLSVEEELADVVIRVMFLSEVMSLKLPEAILAKVKFNSNRPLKHGGKRF